MYVGLQLAPYRRAAPIFPGKCGQSRPPMHIPGSATTKPNNTTTASTMLNQNTTAHSSFSILVLQKQFYEIQVLSGGGGGGAAAAAACLDVSFPIDHFPPDQGGNGFRRTTSDSRRR